MIPSLRRSLFSLMAFAFFTLGAAVSFASPSTQICAEALKGAKVKIQIYGEWHFSPQSMTITKQLIDKAVKGEAYLFFESFPRLSNTQPKIKNELLREMGIPVQLSTLTHVKGLDNEFYALHEIAGAFYLSLRSNTPDLYFLEAFASILHRRDLKKQIPLSEFSEASKVFLNPKRADKMQAEISSRLYSQKKMVMDFFREFNLAMAKLIHKSNPDFPIEDVADYPGTFESYTDSRLKYRDQYMAESILEHIQALENQKEIHVSIGKFHAPGILRALNLLLPNADIQALDVEDGTEITENTDMTGRLPEAN